MCGQVLGVLARHDVDVPVRAGQLGQLRVEPVLAWDTGKKGRERMCGWVLVIVYVCACVCMFACLFVCV